MGILVVCAGEPPPPGVPERLRAAGVEVVLVPAGEVLDPALDPDGYVSGAGGPRVDAALLDRMPRLRVVTLLGGARADPAALRARGIAVSPAATPGPILAATTAALLLGVADPGTVGIVGMGRVGRRVAEILRPPGPRLVYFSRTRRPDVEELYGAAYLPLGDLVAAADRVTLHLPGSAPAGILGPAELARARGIDLVSTSPAHLVDPAALLDALHAGRVRRVAVPYEPGDALRELGAERVLRLPAYPDSGGWDRVVAAYADLAQGRTDRGVG